MSESWNDAIWHGASKHDFFRNPCSTSELSKIMAAYKIYESVAIRRSIFCAYLEILTEYVETLVIFPHFEHG